MRIKIGSKQRDGDSQGDILGNKAETVKELLDGVRSSPEFRGSVSLAPEMPLELEKYIQAEEICATDAIKIAIEKPRVTLDMGKCIMCGRCQEAAPELFKVDSRFAPPANKRQDLIEFLGSEAPAGEPFEDLGKELKGKIGRILGRSLAIREVDAGSCNGCEVEITALNNPIYDVERFGIHFVASPRHADVLLVTGPASRNMELALKRTYEATPDPKVVVAVGACGCSGGIFGDTCATTGGIDKVVPVDVYVPGCPPRPEAILHGLLLAVDRIAMSQKA